MTKIDRKLDANGLTYTADDAIDEFKRYAQEYSLFNFMESIIAKLKHNGKIRTSETYKSTLNSFKNWSASETVDFIISRKPAASVVSLLKPPPASSILKLMEIVLFEHGSFI